MNYASPTKRLTNGLIDGITILYLWATLFILISKLLITLDIVNGFNDRISYYWILTLIPFIFAYYLFFEGIFKTTLGKIITKTKIIRSNGDPIAFTDVLIRTSCRLVPMEQLSFLFGKKVVWHDSVSDTRLVNIN